MSESALDRIAALQELPDGAMPNAGIAIIQWLDTDGHLRWGSFTAGDVPLSTTLGLLDMAKNRFMHDNN